MKDFLYLFKNVDIPYIFWSDNGTNLTNEIARRVLDMSLKCSCVTIPSGRARANGGSEVKNKKIARYPQGQWKKFHNAIATSSSLPPPNRTNSLGARTCGLPPETVWRTCLRQRSRWLDLASEQFKPLGEEDGVNYVLNYHILAERIDFEELQADIERRSDIIAEAAKGVAASKELKNSLVYNML